MPPPPDPPAAAEPTPRTSAGPRPRVAVAGAGAFGGWTALALLRRGAAVTLLDAWGPGNPRASSGGESRVIRGMYGADRLYTEWVARSFERWLDCEARWGVRLYHSTGLLWLFSAGDDYARASLPLLQEAGLPVFELSPTEAAKRYPQIDFAGVRTVFFEQRAGTLAARRACRRVAEAVVEEGGAYRQTAVRPGPIRGGALERLELADGSSLKADAYVFACGPWLGELFPDVVGRRIVPTRQEVYFFGTPAGDPRFELGRLPVWIDFGKRIFYGMPAADHRGFKIADDTRGEPLDPTTEERSIRPEPLARARALLARRFPALAGAPLIESRVCQYECTPDGHLVLDRHPAAENVWIAGGGSGHGFKLGPAVGEHLADLVLGAAEPLPRLSLARLAADPQEPLRSQFSSGAEG